MLRTTLLVAVVCAAAAGCSPQLTRQERAVQERILSDRMTAWARVLNNRDRDSLAIFYDQVPELTVAWPDGRRTHGWEEQAEAVRDFFRVVARINRVVQEEAIDVLSLDVAVATFRHSTDIILMTTDREIFTGQGTLVWVRNEARDWVIHLEHISRNPGSSPG